MLNQEAEERLAEHLVQRIEETNEFILKKIGEVIKEIGTLNPSKAYQVSQILKYGGSYEEIAQALAKASGKNVQEIYKIFDEVAKENKQFSRQFYKYRNKDFIPYEKDVYLKQIVDGVKTLTAEEYLNIARTRGIGFVFKDVKGNRYFKDLQSTYYEVIDRGILSISQGKQTFQQEMRNIINEIGNSGIVQYKSGYTRRLDSAVRMNLLDGVRQLSNEMNLEFAKQYDADGVEISVHTNPAPDHADIQGRQFKKEQYDILENGGKAKDVKGVEYDGAEKRHISEYNCYHKIFPIIVGVSEPLYTDAELKKIQEDNIKGFEYEGKHYTMYEGTQLQRRLETEIRRQKEKQILARASGEDFKQDVIDAQSKITALNRKYNELCKVSGLKPKKVRMSVSGYRRTSVVENNYNLTKFIDFIKNNKTNVISYDFNYEEFMNEYNKFYNSLDKNEIKKVYDDYKEWFKTEEKTTHPIGKFLNKTTGYDKLPELIEKEDFWKDENGVQNETSLLDERHWYRGIDGNNINDVRKYVENFKNGEYYAGTGYYGNGTYATQSYYVANEFAMHNEEGILFIIPKEDAKIIDFNKIATIKNKLIKYINSDDELYLDFTSVILNDEGYLAQLLGFDIISLSEDAKLILNRGSIKVVK